MASLKEMRNRIGSVKATQKITKAMQMVAAAKLRRAQDAAESARPYATRMASVIANLAQGVSGDGAPLLLKGTGREQKHLVVVATADRGLAGGFNSSIARAAREYIGRLIRDGKDVQIICIGRKGRDQLRRYFGERILHTYEIASAKTLTLDLVQPVATQVLELFEAGEADVVTLFYSRFKSVISQVPTARKLIPAEVHQASAGAQPDLKGGVYTYEPDEESILEALLPRNIAVQLLGALLENQAGFFASQMSAMDNATRNAGDMIASLTLQYNRSRQAQITKELIEIISGAEAL
ncbi:F0F1 ATP synthase subunit gamma [Caulobacter sp. S45]|jgi:F-type H+-transporting ATPase subunit gamma|uniref:F0F1 ATP synthase subunit gamma n=1 Tax=Caulobacter sp. S45 TaxID=1641861 RepID=UPI00131B9229|nr:F0F1 ATP synthase subunit gamma [Caulobacter sp. S45]